MKSCEDGSLQIIYTNPTGVLLKEEKCAVKLVKAFVTFNPEIHIIDIKYKQTEDNNVSGAFTVNNLIKLVLSNTDSFDTKDFQRILSASENIDQLRTAHDRLTHDYIAPASIIDSDRSAFELKRDEPFEYKVKYQKESMPPAYEEELFVGMHILGEEGMAQLDIDQP